MNNARFLKYVWPFYNIMHERVKMSKTWLILMQLLTNLYFCCCCCRLQAHPKNAKVKIDFSNDYISRFEFIIKKAVKRLKISFTQIKCSKKGLQSLREKCPNTEFFSGQHFAVFSANTGKYWPEKTLYLDILHAVNILPDYVNKRIAKPSNQIFQLEHKLALSKTEFLWLPS